MKAILTSAGLDNRNLVDVFLNLLNQPIQQTRALFVPAALTMDEQIEYAHCFMEDLTAAGFTADQVDTYTLDDPFDADRIMEYDVIYFTGGDPKRLMKKIRAQSFEPLLQQFLDQGGIYFGASAGSDITTQAVEDNLGYFHISIACHDKEGSPLGSLDMMNDAVVRISDIQAIVVDGDEARIVQ